MLKSLNYREPVSKLLLLLLLTLVLVVIKFLFENNQGHYISRDINSLSFNSTIHIEAEDKYQLIMKKASASTEQLLFSFISTQPVTLFVKRGKEKPAQFILNSDSSYCSTASNGQFLCKILLVNTPERTTLTFLAEQSPTTIKKLNFKKMKITDKSQLSFINYELIFLLLVMPLPFIWFFHKNILISQWIIVSTGLVCLFLIQPAFSFALLFFLYSVYKVGVNFRQSYNRNVQKLALGILIAFILLFFGKYFPKFYSMIFPNIGNTFLAVPLGTSYFVIRIIDTLLAQYRGHLLNITFREFLCYIIFPPTAPAGPIENLEGFRTNRLKVIIKDDIAYGLGRILIGMFKKIVIASYLISPIVESYFYEVASNPLHANNWHVVLFLTFSFLYAYVDFSAYSDIAIGGGRLYGYKIIENFTWPILAENLHVYWRSWHRSLSLWCFRNVYFPLTISTRNIYIPLYITMAMVGLWHIFGLSWYIWSIYHATGLTILTLIQKKKWISPHNKLWFVYARPLRIGLTLLFVIAGYSFVIFNDFSTALQLFFNYWKSIIKFGIKLCLQII